MLALSGFWAAGVLGARVSIVAVLLISVRAVLRRAAGDLALVLWLLHWDWLIDALSVAAIVLGALVVIVANDWSVLASFLWAACVDGARVLVVAVLWSVDASLLWAAGVDGACVVVLAHHWSEAALARLVVAGVDGALVVVITVGVGVIESLVRVAEYLLAFVRVLLVELLQVDWRVNATLGWAAGVDGALVSVITRDEIVVDLSSLDAAPVLGARVVVVHWLWSVLASTVLVTSVNGAWVVVIAADWSVLASLLWVARVLGALVSVLAAHWSMNALVSVAVAVVGGACVSIVTVDVLGDALSSLRAARGDLARNVLAVHWSEDALSVDALVGGALVVVVANDIAVDTPLVRIALLLLAHVVSALDRLVDASVV